MPPPGLQLPPSDERPAENQPAEDPARFRCPLRFDPVRLLAGVLTRWPWILAGMLAFGSLGAIAGKWLTKQSFSLSVALIKRRVPQTVKTSQIGPSFRPAELNDATLRPI